MSASSVGSGSAYNYLQSLLQQQTPSSKTESPIETLLDAFYPNGDNSRSSSTTTTTVASSATSADASGNCAPLSPDTFGALISMQGTDPVAAKAQSIFAGLDGNGDGSISKSEFENAFGSSADTSKVDGLFSALDANGDGSVSQDELTSAVKDSQAHHHHHHAHSGGAGGQNQFDALMSATSGANSQTTSNADGSSSTTITYADGSSIILNTLAASNGSTSNSGQGQQISTYNMLEKLIQMQAQMIAAPGNPDASLITSI